MEPGESVQTHQWQDGDSAAREKAREHLSLLLRLIANGDQDAMAEAYKLTSAKLYGVLLQMLPDKGAADEVLQEVYLTVWRRAGSFSKAQGSPMTWLITITRNKAIDRLRSDKHTRKSRPIEDVSHELADEEPSALKKLETHQDAQRLHWCLDQLEDRQREAIRTAFFAGVTYQELADRSSVPVGTMKSWIRRGLLRLKACLEA